MIIRICCKLGYGLAISFSELILFFTYPELPNDNKEQRLALVLGEEKSCFALRLGGQASPPLGAVLYCRKLSCKCIEK